MFWTLQWSYYDQRKVKCGTLRGHNIFMKRIERLILLSTKQKNPSVFKKSGRENLATLVTDLISTIFYFINYIFCLIWRSIELFCSIQLLGSLIDLNQTPTPVSKDVSPFQTITITHLLYLLWILRKGRSKLSSSLFQLRTLSMGSRNISNNFLDVYIIYARSNLNSEELSKCHIDQVQDLLWAVEKHLSGLL